MFIIKENENKTSINWSFPTMYCLFLALYFFPFCENVLLYRKGINGVIWTLGIISFVFWFYYKHEKLKILDFDWEKKIIFYKTNRSELIEIPLKQIEIECIPEIGLRSNYYINFYLVDCKGEKFFLYKNADYRESMKLVRFFYDLHKKNILTLNKAGIFLAENPISWLHWPNSFWELHQKLLPLLEKKD